MSAGAALLTEQEQSTIQSQVATAEKAKPVAVDQSTKQEAQQQKEREKAIARGEILTPERRLEIFKQLTANPDGATLLEVSPRRYVAVAKEGDGYVAALTTEKSLTKHRRPLTETQVTCHYDSDGAFKKMTDAVTTDTALEKGTRLPSHSTFKQKAELKTLWAEKFGDRLLKKVYSPPKE